MENPSQGRRQGTPLLFGVVLLLFLLSFGAKLVRAGDHVSAGAVLGTASYFAAWGLAGDKARSQPIWRGALVVIGLACLVLYAVVAMRDLGIGPIGPRRPASP